MPKEDGLNSQHARIHSELVLISATCELLNEALHARRGVVGLTQVGRLLSWGMGPHDISDFRDVEKPVETEMVILLTQ